MTTESSVDQIHAALCETIINIEDLRDKYQGNGNIVGKIVIKSRWQSVFDGSLIGLGIASVATAFYGAPVKAIGGVAITASGLQQYRNYYDPAGQGLTYIRAVKAARCVSTDAEYLLNDSPQPLWDAIQSLKQAIANVQAASAQLQTASSSAGLTNAEQATAAKQSETGSDATQAALTAANSALAAAIAEARAYNDAPATVDAAHDAIKNYVDLALHRTPVDYSSLQTAITNAVQSATTVEAGVQQAQSSLLAAVAASGKANASSGATPNGAAPQVTPANSPTSLKAATAAPAPTTATGSAPQAGSGIAAPNPSPGSSTPQNTPAAGAPQGGASPSQASQLATAAAQTNANAVASLIAATNNALLYTQDKRFTSLSNQISTTCVAALSS